MKTFTKDDVPCSEGGSVELGDGFSIRVKRHDDQDQTAPWEAEDGHGPVSEWTARDKRPGEWILCQDHRHKRFYDFESAMKTARKEWGLCDEELAKLAAELGRPPSKGEIAAEAVRQDFNRLRGWCDDDWRYIGVVVTLRDSENKELLEESLWGIESDGDYWKEVAADLANTLLAEHAKETAEAAYWAARDTITK